MQPQTKKPRVASSLPVVCLIETLTQPSADQSPGRPAEIAGKPKEEARVKPVAEKHCRTCSVVRFSLSSKESPPKQGRTAQPPFSLDIPASFRYQGCLPAQVAQSVEQWTENPRVGGSTPSLGTKDNPASSGEERKAPRNWGLFCNAPIALAPFCICFGTTTDETFQAI